MAIDAQCVDPEVSRAKFAREIKRFRSLEATYRKRGVFLLGAKFPSAAFMFVATKVRGVTPVMGAVTIDFTDYDLQPLSVQFIDPFTAEPVAAKDNRLQLYRAPTLTGLTPETVQALAQQGRIPVSPLVQANSLDDPPFLCLPGVREYHDNPAHSGDPWLLYRNSGAGSLAFILDKIWTYGPNLLEQVQFQVQQAQILFQPQNVPV